MQQNIIRNHCTAIDRANMVSEETHFKKGQNRYIYTMQFLTDSSIILEITAFKRHTLTVHRFDSVPRRLALQGLAGGRRPGGADRQQVHRVNTADMKGSSIKSVSRFHDIRWRTFLNNSAVRQRRR